MEKDKIYPAFKLTAIVTFKLKNSEPVTKAQFKEWMNDSFDIVPMDSPENPLDGVKFSFFDQNESIKIQINET